MASHNIYSLLCLALSIGCVGCHSNGRPSSSAIALQHHMADGLESNRPVWVESGKGSVQLASFQINEPAEGSENKNSKPLSVKPKMGLMSSQQPTSLETTFEALTLAAAIQLGLERNPDLTAARAAEPVANSAYNVAATYPFNPQFQTQILPISRDPTGADGAVSQQHAIVQTFERGGQQRYRESAAIATVRQVNHTIQAAELANTTLTTRLYFTAIYQRELRELNQTLTDLNDSLIGVMERREKAGQANAADVELAKLQSLAAQRQLRLAIAKYQTAIRALQTQLNWEQQTGLELDDPWSIARWQSVAAAFGIESELPLSSEVYADATELNFVLNDLTLRQIVNGRPDVMAARSATAVAAENLGLADAMRIPSLQAGPMFQRDASSTVYWGVQAQFDIPVVNTGRPLVQQRCAELRQQQIIAEQLEQRAMLEARAAIARYERARQQILTSGRNDSGANVDSLKIFDDQFKAGQITVLQVFAARSALAQSQQGHFDLLNEVSQAAADVMQATGLDPQRLLGESE